MDEKYISRRTISGKTYFRVVMPRSLARELNLKDATIGTRSKLEKAIKIRDKFFKDNNLMHLLEDEGDIEAQQELKLKELTPGIYQEVSVPYVTTIDQLLQLSKIDTDVWEVDKAVVNAWGVTMKAKDGLPYKTQNHQVKAFLKRKYGEIDVEFLQELLKDMPKSEKIKKVVPKGDHLLEINICDLHLGKLAWAPETGEHYDLKIAQDRFLTAIRRLLALSSAYDTEKILFPIGSDFFQIDNNKNETTHGTPQSVEGRWSKLYNTGVALLIKAVSILREVAPVEVVLIPGNHDQQSSYCAAHCLGMYYRDDENVNVDWSPTLRKYRKYYDNLIGLAHGQGPKQKDWFELVASEAAELWGITKFRYIHLGHYHHQKTEEHRGLTISHLGSLSSADAWHSESGYTQTRKSASGFVYSRKHGMIAELTCNVAIENGSNVGEIK